MGYNDSLCRGGVPVHLRQLGVQQDKGVYVQRQRGADSLPDTDVHGDNPRECGGDRRTGRHAGHYGHTPVRRRRGHEDTPQGAAAGVAHRPHGTGQHNRHSHNLPDCRTAAARLGAGGERYRSSGRRGCCNHYSAAAGAGSRRLRHRGLRHDSLPHTGVHRPADSDDSSQALFPRAAQQGPARRRRCPGAARGRRVDRERRVQEAAHTAHAEGLAVRVHDTFRKWPSSPQ